MLIRDAVRSDFVAIAPIYVHYVLHSAATFELEPPGEEEIAQRAEAVARLGLPYLVAEDGDPASIRLHERCGFRVVGRLTGVGHKHDRWLDTVLMQRSLE